MEEKLENQTFIVTGNYPLEERGVERIIRLEGGTLDPLKTWPEKAIIVIGRQDFDEDFLLRSINVRHAHGFKFDYLSQEAFFEFWLDGILPDYFEGDPRIEEHEGLSFLASVGFEWPTISDIQGLGTLDDSVSWNKMSLLASEFKYRARKGISERTRRKRLANAVTAPDGLGLEVVANYLAFFIRLNRNKWDCQDAVEKWTSDLGWLYDTYYQNSIYRFSWPTY
jgi:hypothetical protein